MSFRDFRASGVLRALKVLRGLRALGCQGLGLKLWRLSELLGFCMVILWAP